MQKKGKEVKIMTKKNNEQDENTPVEPEVVELKNAFVRIKGQDYAIRAERMEKQKEHTVIYWTTKAGQAKKTTVLTSEITQIDEDAE